MNKNSRKDLLWIVFASTLILLWGSIPTWAGYQVETEKLRFRGIYFDSQDYAVHISMMEAGRHGETAYQFRFTTESHNPAYLRLFYVVLGRISMFLNIPTETTFQLARWILGYLALFTLYELMKHIFPDAFWSRTAFLLAALGSGLGWLQLILNLKSGPITPIDFWLIDCYVFFSLSLFPHFAFVTAGMCGVMYHWLDYLESPNWKTILWISIFAIMVQFVNPIALAAVDAGLFGAALSSWWNDRKIRWRDVSALGILAISQLPVLAYNFIILNSDPIWSQFTTQNQTLSPPPVYYAWGFAPFLPFVIIATAYLFRHTSKASVAALFWAISGFALAYAPLLIQRRFLQNVTIPLAILTVQGLIKIFDTRPAQRLTAIRWKSSLIILFVFIASLSSIQLSLGRVIYLQTYPDDLYYSASLDKATTWLRDNARYNDFLLATEKTSQVLVQDTGLRAYFGHEMETLHYTDKQAQIISFFRGEMDDLATPPIQWIIYGPYERALAPDFQPGNNLTLVHDTQQVKIYRVK